MDKTFKDLALDERTEYAHAQMHFWRGVLRELNRELTAVTPGEREALRTRVIDAVEAKELEIAEPSAPASSSDSDQPTI